MQRLEIRFSFAKCGEWVCHSWWFSWKDSEESWNSLLVLTQIRERMRLSQRRKRRASFASPAQEYCNFCRSVPFSFSSWFQTLSHSRPIWHFYILSVVVKAAAAKTTIIIHLISFSSVEVWQCQDQGWKGTNCSLLLKLKKVVHMSCFSKPLSKSLL